MSDNKEKYPYPECDKWAKVHNDAVSILGFLEWKDAREPREIHISYQDLVYEYFEIDPKKLEEERQAMLESIR